ncbi:glycosyltransferase involved in cell wall biosynthesis [Actinomadura pelletieri DSM 43383]|uniref:Glycosyltransferase involved in cell wall biosynthesis n=1 Tax=Actinomadura pelletieri DSM 43383 TaxID=1120940 RepID=A0A495QA56_9ACTN|nr:glycosyltransferase family 4 protein [Actinomadura pelletieri]RKS68390.1 glycosyltransferase involved in cell wall biosynthesis [Actinomadura pelletieri DSM 43383]
MVQGEEGAEATASRGRIVMLVDNGVTNDSRVQKAAHSTAEAGWEVHLIGSTSGTRARTWTLGKAKVRLVPVPMTLQGRPRSWVRTQFRRPLAYATPETAAYRRRLVRSRRSDLAASRLARANGFPTPPQPVLMARRVATKVQGKWVALRERQTKSLAAARSDLDSSFDRLGARFWQKVLGDRCWRVLDRSLWDWELSFGPVIDKLQPDIIHANDFRMVGVGARAVLRARAKGRDVKLVWDAHEFLPGMNPWVADPRWLPAMVATEREYSGMADEVLTVSEPLVDLLIDHHGLKKRPTVVLNAPQIAGVGEPADDQRPAPDLRELCGIDASTPLGIYSGVASPKRGLGVMIEALPKLPDLHLAFVVNRPKGEYMQELRARAKELGVADRISVLGYVPFHQVVEFLSAADFGVQPLHQGLLNHEIALSTKFFEYSHARLPIIVSDVKAMADTVRKTGQGEVFQAGDVADYVRAVEAILADPDKYRRVYDDRPDLLKSWTWDAQAEILNTVYSRLLPEVPTKAAQTASSTA